MIRLSLSFPPSANALWRSHNGRNILSEPYRKWKRLVAHEINAALLADDNLHGIVGPYRMTLTLDRPDKRKRDLSNRIKAVEDALVAAGVVHDDSDCQSLTVQWSDKPPAKPAFVHVEIEEIQ
jgi:crossover junction endodeoxyribonuclease RusA